MACAPPQGTSSDYLPESYQGLFMEGSGLWVHDIGRDASRGDTPTNIAVQGYYNAMEDKNGARDFTVLVDGIPQTLGGTINLPGSPTCSDDINSFHVNAGQIVQVFGTPTTALADNKYFSGSPRPPSPGSP